MPLLMHIMIISLLIVAVTFSEALLLVFVIMLWLWMHLLLPGINFITCLVATAIIHIISIQV